MTSLTRISRRNLATTATAAKAAYDLVVVGGGIVGLATARELLLRFPKLKVAVLEKEKSVGMHQTGHNSGVIHAGIYYKPGSLKAKLCVQGLDLSYAYFDEKKIPYKKIGKLIIALNEHELKPLEELNRRAELNGVKDLRFVDANEMKEIEPHCVGVRGIYSPNTGIVDWGLVAQYYVKDIEQAGGDVLLSHQVLDFNAGMQPKDFSQSIDITTNQGLVTAKHVVTCAGAYSDRLARKTGGSADPMIVPIRGEYQELVKSKHYLVKGLVYPVPDPTVPFLGVHFTPTMKGEVLIGPNAVVAYSREGYSYFDVSFEDLKDALTFRGLHKLALKHFKFGIGEQFRSIFLSAQTKLIQAYIPEITRADFKRGHSGVRAQAMNSAGDLVDDFVFESGFGAGGENILHVRNAPSPGATSSLAIAKMIADRATQSFSSLSVK